MDDGGLLFAVGAGVVFGACAGALPVVFVIKCTSTRRFFFRPSEVLFDSTGLSLPRPTR